MMKKQVHNLHCGCLLDNPFIVTFMMIHSNHLLDHDHYHQDSNFQFPNLVQVHFHTSFQQSHQSLQSMYQLQLYPEMCLKLLNYRISHNFE